MKKNETEAVPVRRCFRCGTPIPTFDDGGQVTISGFLHSGIPAYYNNFTLCRRCHNGLIDTMHTFLFTDYDD